MLKLLHENLFLENVLEAKFFAKNLNFTIILRIENQI